MKSALEYSENKDSLEGWRECYEDLASDPVPMTGERERRRLVIFIGTLVEGWHPFGTVQFYEMVITEYANLVAILRGK